MFDSPFVVLIVVTFFAATINGAIGYGFSSITVPIALLFYTNRILNPALVLVELVVNGYMLLVNGRGIVPVFRRFYPILVGLAPGIFAGVFLLSSIDPEWAKFFTYVVLLPLLFMQLAGFRHLIRQERIIGYPFGFSLGVLYSATTISGPPIALLLNNQGLVKSEFRAAVSLIRAVESGLTAYAYYLLGLYSVEGFDLLESIIPSVLVGIPLGYFLIRRIASESFRRVCMGLDVIIVGFGLSHVVASLGLIDFPAAYGIFLLASFAAGYLLYRFFTTGRPLESQGISGIVEPDR